VEPACDREGALALSTGKEVICHQLLQFWGFFEFHTCAAFGSLVLDDATQRIPCSFVLIVILDFTAFNNIRIYAILLSYPHRMQNIYD